MQFNSVQRTHPNKTAKRIGRGGKRGTYSGRGIKGQKARAGTGMRPQLRDIIKKLHKRRGYGKNRSRSVNDAAKKPLSINVGELDSVFGANEKVTPQTLAEKGVIRASEVHMPVKILGDGALSKPLSVSGCRISQSAQSAIEGAGGVVEQEA